MTLYQMSYQYREDAARFRMRIAELRMLLRDASTRSEADALRRRSADLQLLRRQSDELAQLTGRYYERSYHCDKRYTL